MATLLKVVLNKSQGLIAYRRIKRLLPLYFRFIQLVPVISATLPFLSKISNTLELNISGKLSDRGSSKPVLPYSII